MVPKPAPTCHALVNCTWASISTPDIIAPVALGTENTPLGSTVDPAALESGGDADIAHDVGSEVIVHRHFPVRTFPLVILSYREGLGTIRPDGDHQEIFLLDAVAGPDGQLQAIGEGVIALPVKCVGIVLLADVVGGTWSKDVVAGWLRIGLPEGVKPTHPTEWARQLRDQLRFITVRTFLLILVQVVARLFGAVQIFVELIVQASGAEDIAQ